MRIIIGGDHAGYFLKEHLKKYLARKKFNFTDVGPASAEAVDYPDFAEKVAKAVSSGQYDRGILICGSGIGVAITANKIPGIRAAVCNDVVSAKLSREHNDTNVLALGARMLTEAQAEEIVESWLRTDFVKEGRHIRRVQKITEIEKKYLKIREKYLSPSLRKKRAAAQWLISQEIDFGTWEEAKEAIIKGHIERLSED